MTSTGRAPATAGTGRATARAGTNIALVKYWGKRDAALNLPRTGSLSLTLGELDTVTTVELAAGPGADTLVLDGAAERGAALARVAALLDLVRAGAGRREAARVVTRNSFPTAAGLASSASGFAALVRAAAAAFGLDLAPAALSALARRGSGSAARSIFGGFVEMAPGTRADGADAVAAQLLPPDAWAVRLVVAITTEGPKAVGSRAGMTATAASSPLYEAWVTAHAADLAAARAAVAARDLPALGEVAERNCLGMHATMMTARPALFYWNEATIAAMHAVWALRAAGTGVWFTIDAGPHVKALCAAADAPRVAAALAAAPGVLRTIVAAPGAGARLEPDAVGTEPAP
ncbi:MAG TPA: diphosphomevalonate decarboxylase [Polyangia bacterium]|jgi:diphosphomevalonate decarboxylase